MPEFLRDKSRALGAFLVWTLNTNPRGAGVGQSLLFIYPMPRAKSRTKRRAIIVISFRGNIPANAGHSRHILYHDHYENLLREFIAAALPAKILCDETRRLSAAFSRRIQTRAALTF